MKKFSVLFLNSLFLGLLLIGAVSCKKSDKNDPTPANPSGGGEKISFALQGDGFSNQSFAVGSSSTNTVALGAYNVPDNYTGVGVAGNISAGKSISAVIVFRGKTTGEYALGPDEQEDEAYMTLLVKDGSTEKMYTATENAGTLKVSNYGNVGGKIEGTFSATLTRIDLTTGGTSTVTISNGKFSVARVADEQQ